MGDSDEAALERERDFLFMSLADLEAEHEAGDLDEADFVELRSHYVARAADSIRALQAATGGVSTDDHGIDERGAQADTRSVKARGADRAMGAGHRARSHRGRCDLGRLLR